MAQWKKLLNLDSVHQNEVIQVYTDQKFPWDIRRHFSDWIESQNWESVSSDEGQARDVFHAMLNQVDGHYSHLVQENNLLDGPNYPDLRNNLQTLFQANPVNMAKIISQCLSEERRIIASVKMAQDTQDSQIKTIIELSGKYKPRQDEVEQLNGLPISLDLKRQKTDIDVVHFDLIQTRLNVGHLIGNTVKLAEGVVSTVVEEELQSWKLRQQRACIGAPLDTSLHKLKTWFTLAADALNLQLQQLKKLKELDQQCPPNADLLSLRTKCEETTQSLLKNLLKNALVVETQPRVNNAQRPLILKTGVRFSIKTRFLVHLSSFVGMPRVTLVFNKDLDENGTVKGFRNFNFTNKASRMLDAEEMGLVAHFENLGLLPVTEELHFITCAMKLKLIGLTIDIETSTLPLVVISSTAQSHGAWASILWSAMANLWFQNPPSVTWKQLSEVLSWQFQAMSGRGLDHQQLAMLRDKFVDNDDDLVYWNKFYRCDGGWVWIEGILDLITKHLLPIWSEGDLTPPASPEENIPPSLTDDMDFTPIKYHPHDYMKHEPSFEDDCGSLHKGISLRKETGFIFSLNLKKQ
ncbi:hypothetical protein NHX12_006988 [Muraenolepis orangiensis]|uniref:STAT transcription factor protein interaction domain-containing protein n=1 Tax=Muraenolepis orangiensis TaxID=630683 RepID=A0A9Q0DSJ6_9TELE|nr:hypothetical protein NHX12_006988 [Muraenolepis orangiensis]